MAPCHNDQHMQPAHHHAPWPYVRPTGIDQKRQDPSTTSAPGSSPPASSMACNSRVVTSMTPTILEWRRSCRMSQGVPYSMNTMSPTTSQNGTALGRLDDAASHSATRTRAASHCPASEYERQEEQVRQHKPQAPSQPSVERLALDNRLQDTLHNVFVRVIFVGHEGLHYTGAHVRVRFSAYDKRCA